MPLWSPPYKDLDSMRLVGEGFKAWSADLITAEIPPSVSLANQVLGASLVPFKAGTIVTNLHMYVSTVAATSTSAWMALYSKAGARLGMTADLTTAWEASGLKTHALAAAYTIPTDDVYYIAGLFVGTTGPRTLCTGQTASVAMTALGSNFRPYVVQAAQASPPATATWADWSHTIWMGAS